MQKPYKIMFFDCHWHAYFGILCLIYSLYYYDSMNNCNNTCFFIFVFDLKYSLFIYSELEYILIQSSSDQTYVIEIDSHNSSLQNKHFDRVPGDLIGSFRK